MDPGLQILTDTRTVYPPETGTPTGTRTPEKSPRPLEPTWAERLLHGCSPRIAVYDVWPSSEIAAAAKALGVLYISELTEPYDCVISLLPRKKHATAFCYYALSAWTGLLPGGSMVLVMKEDAFDAMHRFWPSSPRVIDLGTALPFYKAYVWRKPISKGGHKTRHAVRVQKTSATR